MKLGPSRSKPISRLLALGTIGAASLLGLAIPANATPRSIPADGADAARRLTAIEEALLAIAPSDLAPATDDNIHPAWGYRWFNGPRRGWRNFRPRWNNFRPGWNNFWRNW